MSKLDPVELDLLISFHKQKADYHASRVQALEAKRGAAGIEINAEPVKPSGITPDQDQGGEGPFSFDQCLAKAGYNPDGPPAMLPAIAMMVLEAIRKPSEGNDGRTERGIAEFVAQTYKMDAPAEEIQKAIYTLIKAGKIRKDGNLWKLPAMRGGRPTSKHPWHKQTHVQAKEAKARKKDRTKAGPGGERARKGPAGMLRTPGGEPVSRTRAIQLILAKAQLGGEKGGLTNGQIRNALAGEFKDAAPSKTVGAALCTMRNRGQVRNPAEGKWALASKKGGKA